MSNTLFESIYNLTYEPLITPYTLLENLKYDNYHEINFTKENSQVIVNIKCTVDNALIQFIYYFDDKNFLNKIISIDINSVETTLFDRASELDYNRKLFENLSFKKII